MGLFTVAYVPSPNFSSCWNELGCLRLSMVGMTVWPPPRFRTEMDESVRLATDSVPAWVGWSAPGGALDVYLGSQRISLAVVSWFAMASGGRGGVVGRGWCWWVDCAVLEMGGETLWEAFPRKWCRVRKSDLQNNGHNLWWRRRRLQNF